MKTLTREAQKKLTPQKCLDLLLNGNARFQSNLKTNRNLLEQVNTTADGQFPFAVILSCIDSRTSVELIFDQGLGDVFSVRVAGNVLNNDVLASMEFACALAGSKLIVVLGHSSCGAVKGACAGTKLGHLTSLLEKLRPAMSGLQEGQELSAEERVQRVATENVAHVVRQIRTQSEVLEAMIRSGKIGIVGAMYSVQSGTVEFNTLAC